MLGKNDRGFGGGKRQQPPLEVYRMAVLASPIHILCQRADSGNTSQVCPFFVQTGGGFWHLLLRAMLGVNLDTLIFFGFFCYMYYESFPNGGELVYVKFKI